MPAFAGAGVSNGAHRTATILPLRQVLRVPGVGLGASVAFKKHFEIGKTKDK